MFSSNGVMQYVKYIMIYVIQAQGSDVEQSTAQPEVKEEVDAESKRSLSSDFEVISDAEVKTVNTAEDIVKKYKKRTKNTLREGNFCKLLVIVSTKITLFDI